MPGARTYGTADHDKNKSRHLKAGSVDWRGGEPRSGPTPDQKEA